MQLRQFGRLVSSIVTANLNQVGRIVCYLWDRWQLRSHQKSITSAKLELGREMTETGVGPIDLRNRVHQLDAILECLEAAGCRSPALHLERQGLLLLLSEAATDVARPLPAAEHLLHSLKDRQAHSSRLAVARRNLFAFAPGDGWRIAAGTTVVLILLAILGFALK
jgi:hypothetical protein